jgi:thymidylate synthase
LKQYLDLVRAVLEHGTEKLPERKLEGGRKLDNSTIGLPNQVFSHDMADGFPLLTTKKMGLKTIAIELEGFIKGITSKAWYKERGCNIWNEWANPEVVNRTLDELQTKTLDNVKELPDIYKKIQLITDDLGPIYGYQWRHFDEHYGNQHEFCWGEVSINENGVRSGTDQLKNVVDTLKSHPADRRMVCSAWNPNQMNMMALPPCHFAWVVTVYDNKLNLCWCQRSCDLALGVPFNIASYALLLKLLAKHANLAEGNLTGILIDCHIYKNQIEGMKEQLKREPRKLPNVDIVNNDGPWKFDFWRWEHSHILVEDYNPHPPIKMEVTV